MTKKILSAALSVTMTATLLTGYVMPVGAAAKEPQYQQTARQMEALDRGLIAVKTENDARGQTQAGVYLSWRLLGTESLTDQAFDIYRNGTKITTTAANGATNYLDPTGTTTSKYRVVPKGGVMSSCPEVTPINTNLTARSDYYGNGTSKANSFTYVDIPINRPADVSRPGDGKTSYYHNTLTNDGSVDKEGGANDASVGDLDGDGDYEIILKWDPTDSKDSAGSDWTGPTYLDAYDFTLNGTTTADSKLLWRIDLGPNVTSGQHYSPFMVYDFDGDGEAELAVKTAPGSYSTTDGGKTKHYVTEAGDTNAIKNADNSTIWVGAGGIKGKNTTGPEYLTIFESDGTPAYTTDFIPRGSISSWGDSKANRSERYIAGVAYLDGVHPSLIMCRGYYKKAMLRAYDWDGETLSLRWEHDGSANNANTMYGQGNHNMSVADVDKDGKDEIVWGSATLDDDGKTIVENTRYGHGDAMHVNDFDNDGWQEVFSVKEEKSGYANNAADFRRPGTGKGKSIWGKGASGDTGRGVMANIDDEYAKTHPDAMALAWSSSHPNVFTLSGQELKESPKTNSRTMQNFLVYWDGDLSREILDDNQLAKYDAATGYTTRFYNGKDGYLPITSNNYSKHTPSLVADILGDWREEIIAPFGKGPNDTPYLRILISTLPSEYRLTTLMHDSQYRCAIAWQNGGYNQPPHQSYYIGSAALATDASGKELKYLAPAVPYTRVSYPVETQTDPAKSLTLSEHSINIEKNSTAIIAANILPETASKKIDWSSSNTNVATVSGGVITAVGTGTTTITATAKGTNISDTCNVTVYSTPVTGLSVPGYDNISIPEGSSKQISASVLPLDATDKSIRWTSSNENAVTVNDSGMVTGVGAGSSIITATTNEGGFNKDIIVTSIDGETTDSTGTNEFELISAGAGTTLRNGSANSGGITHDGATEGAVVAKDFEVFDDNKATLRFQFSSGGDKDANDAWNWDGREYTFGLRFLDSNGNNILTISQAYQTKAQMTQSTVGAEMTQNLNSDWDEIVTGGNQPLGRSSTSWYITLDFDYNGDTCTAALSANETQTEYTYKKTFDLNGARFKTMQLYTTKDGDGAIKAHPSFSNVSYSRTVATDGVGSALYDKGNATKNGSAWTTGDISDWKVTGGTLAIDSEKRLGFNVNKPGSSYSASKTFSIADGAIVTYDADWYYFNTTARESNTEFIQLGPVKIAAGNGGGSQDTDFKGMYFTKLSLDGGSTWLDTDGDGKPNSIFSGANSAFTNNVHLVIDTRTNTVISLKFAGNEIVKDYKLSSAAGYGSVSFGFDRGGGTNDIAYINGLANLSVIQYVDGAKQPNDPEKDPTVTAEPSDTPEPTAMPSATPTAPPSPTPNVDDITVTAPMLNSDGKVEVTVKNSGSMDQPVKLIVASYDADEKLIDVKLSADATVSANTEAVITAEAPLPEAATYKVMLWNSIVNGFPIMDFADSIANLSAAEVDMTDASDTIEEPAAEVTPAPDNSETGEESPAADTVKEPATDLPKPVETDKMD